MRRPLKPFVTEYKPSSRRQLASTRSSPTSESEAAFSPKAETAFSPKPNESGRSEAVARDLNHRSEDSYEAALRAADALFAPAKKVVSDDPAHHGGEGSEAHTDMPAKGGGRILRVLDEPPSEVVAAFEEDNVPKRRGRKPGSKNKPKLPPAVGGSPASPDMLATVSSAAIERQVASRGRRAANPVVEMSSSRDASDADAYDVEASSLAAPMRDACESETPSLREERGPIDDEGHHAGTPAAPHRVSPPRLAPRVYHRFSWVRTKLKPGEEWKRRLPKICW